MVCTFESHWSPHINDTNTDPVTESSAICAAGTELPCQRLSCCVRTGSCCGSRAQRGACPAWDVEEACGVWWVERGARVSAHDPVLAQWCHVLSGCGGGWGWGVRRGGAGSGPD